MFLLAVGILEEVPKIITLGSVAAIITFDRTLRIELMSWQYYLTVFLKRSEDAILGLDSIFY